MLFLKKKWNSSVNALLLILMVMLGLYLFDDNIGLFATLSTIFGSAENAVRESNVPQIPQLPRPLYLRSECSANTMVVAAGVVHRRFFR